MPSIQVEISGAVAILRLNRPEKLNSFNREMAFLLQDAFKECKTNPAIRAVYLTGSGKAFCAGQDLAEVLDPEGPGMEKILSEHYNPLVRQIRELEKPVIAAVNGVAAGAGANLALACDIIVASSSASFIQAFSKIGLIPDSGGTFMLPRLIGLQRASALMMLGDRVSATEAEAMGMIYKVLSDENFADESFSIAKKLSEMPTRALAYTKHALNKAFENNLDQQLNLEDKLQQQSAATKDFNEGVQAFVQKRNPLFTGE